MNQAEIKRRQAGALSDIFALITLAVIGRLTGDNGITYVAVAAQVYVIVGIVINGGLSDTLGKLLRGKRNKGQYKNADRMRLGALLLQGTFGLLGSLLMLILAGTFAEFFFQVRYSTLILMVLSPAVLLRSVSCALLGCFQGEGAELPTAISKILRYVFILVFSLMFSRMLGNYGDKVSALLMQENFKAMYSGVGVAIAVSVTEVFIVIFLALIYKGSSRVRKKERQGGMYSRDSIMDCIFALCSARWPVFVTEVLMFLPLVIGLLFFGKAAGDENVIALEYGSYFGKYLVVCGSMIALLYVAALPMVAKVHLALRREEQRPARAAFQSGVHVCLVHGIFVSLFVAIMASQLADLFGPENGDAVEKLLRGGSFLIVFGLLSLYFGKLLQMVGKRILVLGAAAAADVLFVLVITVKLNVGAGAGVLALVYGGVAGMFVLCILLGLFAYRQMRMTIDWLRVLVIPLGAGGVAGLLSILLERLAGDHLNSIVALVLIFAVDILVYWGLLLLLKDFREQELEVIPGGRLISMLAQLLRRYD